MLVKVENNSETRRISQIDRKVRVITSCAVEQSHCASSLYGLSYQWRIQIEGVHALNGCPWAPLGYF